jgi:hypothetical protein
MSSSVTLPLAPNVAGIASAIAWLRDHDVPAKRIAGILGIKEGHARQLAFRAQWRVRGVTAAAILESQLRPPVGPFGPVPDELRSRLKVRPKIESWTVRPNPASRRRLNELEEKVEKLGAMFWSGVRHGRGIHRFREVLIEIGRPAHYRRIRILARVRQLLAETYAHVGYSASALEEALTSLLLSRTAYDESQDAHDLEQFAKTTLIVSQTHLLRYEPEQAARYLDLHRDARARISQPLGGEYFRQRGAVAFQSGGEADEEARRNFQSAMTVLAETIEYGQLKEQYEVLNIGTRQMNLLGKVNWEGAMELADYMIHTLPPGEIHISMNVNWAAACGLSTDSPRANLAAAELLDQYRAASVGFGHQATVAWLLSLSPALPRQIRAAWVRRALYENTFKDR